MTRDPEFHVEFGDDGIAVCYLADRAHEKIAGSPDFLRAFRGALDRIEQALDSIRGVVITMPPIDSPSVVSRREILRVRRGNSAALRETVTGLRVELRRLETMGRPVVSTLGGDTLGSGMEIALATHHRIALNRPEMRFGFPDIGHGLIPQLGGITRSVRRFGIQDALTNLLLSAHTYAPAAALEIGLVDELAENQTELTERARAWIRQKPDAIQPWDKPGYNIPGGTPTSSTLATRLPSFPANLRKQNGGAPIPAPHHALCAAVEGAQVDVQTAQLIETRYFLDAACGQTAKNMIKLTCFDRTHVNSRLSGVTVDEAYDPTPALEQSENSAADSSHFVLRVIRVRLREAVELLAEGLAEPSLEQANRIAGHTWSALRFREELNVPVPTTSAAPITESGSSLSNVVSRLLFIQVLEGLRCVEEGVLDSAAEANVASIVGAGFPAWTGGVIQYVNGYPGGLTKFITDAEVFAQRCGPRFDPPAFLRERAKHGRILDLGEADSEVADLAAWRTILAT